jgi:NMD protein affecting ribosome stability and mRNA decay
MRKSVCIKCGKEATIQSYCEEHWLAKQGLFEAEDFTIVQCDGCGRWLYKEWHDKADLLQAIKEAVRSSIKEKGKIEDVRISVKRAGKYIVSIKATGTVPPATLPKEEEKTIAVMVKNLKCPVCIKMLGSYHEAVLQLRGENMEVLMEKVSKLCKGMDTILSEKKEGYNVLFVNKADAKKIATVLRKKGFEVTESYKLVGKKDGKELWKDFYAIR